MKIHTKEIMMAIDREFIIAECKKFLNTNFRKRYQKYKNSLKCERDLKLILEAIINDINEKTTHYSTEIADSFWKDHKLLLTDTSAEVATYDFMLELFKKFLNDSELDHASNSINNIKNILKNGSPLTPLDNLVVASKNANHCQRNWDHTKQIPEKDINTLSHVARNMPSKQNRKYYEFVISTNKDFNNWLYKEGSVDRSHPESFNNSYLRNSQVSAPLVFIFFEYFTSYEEYTKMYKFDEHHYNAMTAIGISAGAVALAANHLGYRTGFCRCLDGQNISKQLFNITNKEQPGAPRLALGIGHPNKNYQWNEIVDGKKITTIQSLPKKYDDLPTRIR